MKRGDIRSVGDSITIYSADDSGVTPVAMYTPALGDIFLLCDRTMITAKHRAWWSMIWRGKLCVCEELIILTRTTEIMRQQHGKR